MAFNLSNTLGHGMVLQRAPQEAMVWGFGVPQLVISLLFAGQNNSATVGADGIWRMALPPQPASTAGTNLSFMGSDGSTLHLNGVLFGDVYLCSGQSNMQYTPRSMAGMNNMSAELAAADGYSATIRFFTVGMDTNCGDPKRGATDCSQPFRQLNTKIPQHPNHTCAGGRSCRETWEPASSAALGGSAWNTFSAVCWLMGRDIHDGLGGQVPIGLISSNWGGTPVQAWQPLVSVKDCSPAQTTGGALYNSMIAPFTVGPMALAGASWYQGESNVGQASYYACAFPSMITRWREKFNRPSLWFGFVQIASFGYSHPYGNPPRPETQHSLAAGDLRQAQLAALRLPPPIGMTTAIDTGDWHNIHPPDKQFPSRRLANQALVQIYHHSIAGASFPMYAGSRVAQAADSVTVMVAVRAGGKAVALTTDAPAAATQSTTLGLAGSIPRNACVTAGIASTYPQDCGYPAIEGLLANGTRTTLNATAAIGADGSSIELTARAPSGFKPTASSYGRASWPRTIFFARKGGLPVIPWYANFTTVDPWTPPAYVELSERVASDLQRRVAAATARGGEGEMVEARDVARA